MTTQNCPSCARLHDVSPLAPGHEVLCACGARFPVAGPPPAEAPELSAPTFLRPSQLAVPGAGSSPPASAGAAAAGTAAAAGSAASTEALQDTSVGVPSLLLPGYEMVRVLGRGGMGEVWLARQMSLGRSVAVKVLPPRLAKDPEFVRRFDKEATALASLNHPHIVQIIDRGVEGEHYYFVMEYVEGRSLRDVMRQLSPSEVLRVALQVAQALECAHEHDIIHRDLKPENILLDRRGHVKVADFGLAGIRSPEARHQLTGTAVAMGTLNYMAPEQRRDARSVDGRADLFSFGVVLYEMLTGEIPVGRFKLPSERVPGLDKRVDTVVARLLETEPEARFPRATEVCQALEALVTSVSKPVLPAHLEPARPESTRRRRLRWGWRKVNAALAVVGALVVFLVGLRMVVGGPVSLPWGDDTVVFGGRPVRVVPGKKSWPVNTEGDLHVDAMVEDLADGRVRMGVSFVPGSEEINAHAGTWTLLNGQLQALQGGSEAGGGQLVPRAYLAHRAFSSDDFVAQVAMRVNPLGKEYPPQEADAQHYAELSFRAAGLQVSVYAIPDADMRLSWRYARADGKEEVGNSSQDVEQLAGDETPVPKDSTFLVKLQLKKRGNGVEVDAFLNNAREPFAHKFLEGFQGRSAQVALGCRNLACSFDDLVVRGVQTEKLQHNKVAESQRE